MSLKRLCQTTAIGLFLAVSTLAPAQAQRDTNTVVVAITSDIRNFNIAMAFDASWFPSTLYFERLVAMDYGPDFAIRPLLAREWEISDDGLTYTFHLEEGVTWHDGEPFTSHDVAYTINAIVENETYGAAPLRVIESVETPDDLTVVFHLSEPSAPLLSNLATYPRTPILPAHLYEGQEWEGHPNNMNPIGTGPYRLAEHRPGEYIAFTRYDDYWGETPEIENVVFRVVPDDNVQAAQLLAGEIHAMNNPPPINLEPILDADPDVAVDAPPGPMTYYFAMNVTTEPFDDPALRRALAYAIDREQLAETASFGIFEPARGTYVAAIDWAFDESVQLPETDLEEAARLLDEAGYPLVDGERFAFDIWVSRTTTVDSAQIIREQLRPLGITVNVNQMEDGLFRQRLADMEHDSYVYGNWWGPDPSEWANYTVTGRFWNRMGYSNERVDELFEMANLALSEEERAAHYSEIQQILLEDMPRIPLFDSGPYSFAHSTDLVGWFSEEPVSFRMDMRNLRWAD